MLITIRDLRPLAQGGLWALVEYRDGETAILHQHHCCPATWEHMEAGARTWKRSIERTGRRLIDVKAASEPTEPLPAFTLAPDAYGWLTHPAIAPLLHLAWEVA